MNKKVVWLPYDFDTAIGINNEGELVFSYGLEDIDLQRSGENVFNGQDSVIWKNIRAAFFDELRTMWRTLRSSGALSYEVVEQMFEEHQSKWPESLFNEDAYFKYLQPFIESGEDYLGMLLGSKEAQRKWWLYNRFRYMDSKYIAGDALTDTITLRPYGAANISITPYADIYASVAWDDTITQERATRNTTVTLICPYQSMNDNVVTIYSASQLASIGDLSGLMLGVGNFANGTKLQNLKVGDSDAQYSNTSLRSLTLGNNVLLQSLDVRNCPGLGDTSIEGHTQTTVDLSGCTNIEHVYFGGTKVTAVALPNGGILKTLQLPATITNLTVRNQPSITSFSVEGNDYSNITTLRVENCGSAIPVMDILDEIAANSRVRLIGFTTTASSTSDVEDFFDYLDTMKGLDEDGNNLDNAVVSGTITGLGTITGAWLAQMHARYPNVTIEYEHITSNLRYYNGSTLYYTESITDGANGVYAGTPSKASTAQYSYTFAGWSRTDDNTVDADAREAVTADRDVYACYTSTVRSYTIIFKNDDNSTVLQSSSYNYGATPSYNGNTPVSTVDSSKAFKGWSPAISTVTGTATYIASYKSSGTEWTTPGIDVSSAYAVQWDYSGNVVSTILARGGLASAFSDPSPATSISGSGSSPFDSIMPWSGMKRYCMIGGSWVADTDPSFDETAYDTMVYIPPFYFAVEKDTANNKWTWAISPTAQSGYTLHPGSGRYIGRFHTSGDSTLVSSLSGVAPLASTTRPNFRTYSHNKGSNWWMLDIATWSALQMLYLVEFADFHSQSTLGTGHNTGAAGNTGGTTGAAYHTLKISSGDNMYRWVENPFSQVRDWVDGAFFSARAAYVGTNNATFADSTTGLTSTGITLPSSAYITGFGYSSVCPWAFIPDAASGGGASTFVPDYVYSNAGARALYVGGYYAGVSCGFFCFSGSSEASVTSASLGSRLLYIP
mgnify:CR=1 FL=1